MFELILLFLFVVFILLGILTYGFFRFKQKGGIVGKKIKKNPSNDDLIKEIIESDVPMRGLIARMYVEFSKHFLILNGKVNFHDKFVWTFIGILIVGFVGGIITILFQLFYK